MAYDTVIDKTRHQAACKATADAIRGKTGNTAKLTWDPDTGFKNAVNAISTGSTGITPTGTKMITMNGTHNVSEYEYAQVNVETSADPTLGGKTLVTKDGSTSTATFDTGLSEIVTVMLYRNTVTSAGLVSATVVPPLGYINYGGCSSYSTYVKNYTTACSPAVGAYCTIDGGTVNWISTSTETAFQAGTSYIWRAIGYE